MRTITDIIVHEADTPTGKPFTAEDIDQWHRERWSRKADWIEAFNPQFKAIGYHYVIGIDGVVETGRHPDEVGAHCAGCNAHSIGVCLIGKGKYTPAQWRSLQALLENLKGTYPSAVVHGHRHYASAKAQGKTCPDFDVDSYVADGYVPDDPHVA